MVTTVTLNPCTDRSVKIAKFTYGGLNRVLEKQDDASGKGINVSVALKQLGVDTQCVTFNHRNGGDFLLGELTRQGIPYVAVDVPGTLRTNNKIYDLENKVFTELNEGGGQIDAVSTQAILEKIIQNHGDILVLDGSVPPGVPRDIYQQIIASLKDKGIKVILDAEGDLFIEGMKAKPYLVKPNLFELETALKIKLSGKGEIIKAAQQLVATGIEVVCVSMGEQGAVLVSKKEAFYANPLKLDVKGIQGAGDSMVAGISYAIQENLPLEGMLRYAVAAASASLIREGTLMCTREDFEKMLPQVVIEKIVVS